MVLASQDTFHRRAFVTRLSICLRSESLHSRRPRSDQSRTDRTVTSERNTLFPVLTSFRPALLVPWFEKDEDHGLRWRLPATGRTWKMHAVTAYLQRIIRDRFDHRQAIHILPRCRHKSHKDSVWHRRDGSNNPISHIVPSDPNSVHPVRQVHQCIGPLNTNLSVENVQVNEKVNVPDLNWRNWVSTCILRYSVTPSFLHGQVCLIQVRCTRGPLSLAYTVRYVWFKCRDTRVVCLLSPSAFPRRSAYSSY